MANKSDEMVKMELLSIGELGQLKLRVFPGGSFEDQKHWVDGGLCFGDGNVTYDSCDGIWYVDREWTDPLSGRTCSQTPVLAVEGTLALERGSDGNAQYQRFFHVLGAVLSGVMGVYYLKSGKSPLRYDLPQAALNASQLHGQDYLVVTDAGVLGTLVKACAADDQGEVVSRIKSDMGSYFQKFLDQKFGGELEDYFASRSIIRLDSVNIKYLAGSFRNFTESSQRAGHVVLGEFLMAKYMLNEEFYFLLPRLLPREVETLDQSSKKEWLVLRADNLGTLITLDDLEGVNEELRVSILSLKDKPLGGSKAGGMAKRQWNRAMRNLETFIRNGVITVRS